MKLVYTDEAIKDLKRLREFVAVHNPSAAGRIAAELVSKLELLPDFPHMGAPVELAPVPDSIRDMVFGKYVVRYSVHASAIIILRVWHELEEKGEA
ncbi:type II toxin-antitoxin system RelE/ParE family toxin [Gilvimarinus sp. DA14]|uniref:type II toxin-antitoxin system RelE/ParE family toxin n=1 Tax=Gilvimarinus sp. DA14 TaxID=2956798 RepID=UPI0020B89422|nr:type II toxin-antitoxin system RelE/ParE family toxin [Gilvimarinus sp. DA14]UTF60218.1 type II toxin-antitoxin system RelE/ParE family toxin [Gilvimarinus sp. DA14]